MGDAEGNPRARGVKVVSFRLSDHERKACDDQATAEKLRPNDLARRVLLDYLAGRLVPASAPGARVSTPRELTVEYDPT
jgi:hypothetical protein